MLQGEVLDAYVTDTEKVHMAAAALAYRIDPMDGIAEHIKRWMTRTGRNQTDLAERVGVSQKTVSRWKNGESVPAVDTRPALREQLELDELSFDDAIQESERRVLASKTRLQRVGRRPVLERGPYAVGDAAHRRWIGMVRRDSNLDRDVRDLLSLFPEHIDEKMREQSCETFVTFDLLAAESPDMSEDHIRDLWQKVLDCPYVERIGAPVEWVFRLKFPT